MKKRDMMKSRNKLMILLIIAIYMLFLSGCSNSEINQDEYVEEGNKTTVDTSKANNDEKNMNTTPKETGKYKDETNETSSDSKEDKTTLNIRIEGNGKTVIFELNDSSAAKSLYAQLPITIEVENYSNNEKIFYPEQKLDTSDTPLANARKGTLAYYAPWGDVVMFYDDFGSASGLYELGQVESGSDDIASLSGTIKIEQY